MKDFRKIAGLLLAGALAVTAAPRPARAEPAKLFVLPVRSDSWLDQDDRLLEARVALALTRGRRVRPLQARDLTPAARRLLPLDLTECAVPACLRVLGQASGAARVLALELYDDGPTPVLFATLYDPGSGEAVDRRELPRTAARTKGWADEVARWVGTATAGVRPPPPPLPPAPRPTAPLASLEAASGEQGRPEALALVAQLREELARRSCPRLALPAGGAPVTHRLVVSVESFGISDRPHHVHRYRSGALAANLSVIETRTDTVVFTRRATAELTTRAHHTTDQQTLTVLVNEVVSRWLADLDDPAFAQLLTRTL
jgi:hypothetical protein